MTLPFATPDQNALHRQRAWSAYDLAADEDRDGPEWSQTYYRTRCGTACCLAGLLAIDNERQWLINFNGPQPMIDGRAIDPTELNASDEEYVLAKPGDPEWAIDVRHDRQVVHVRYVAAALIGLEPDTGHAGAGGLFAGENTLEDLEQLITAQIGPRPSVGATANKK